MICAKGAGQGLGAPRVGAHGGVYYTTRFGNQRHAAPSRVHQLPNGGVAFQPHPKLHPNVWRVIPPGPNSGTVMRSGTTAQGIHGLGTLTDFITGVTDWFSPSAAFGELGSAVTGLYDSASGGVDWINVGIVAVPVVAGLALVKMFKGRKGRRR